MKDFQEQAVPLTDRRLGHHGCLTTIILISMLLIGLYCFEYRYQWQHYRTRFLKSARNSEPTTQEDFIRRRLIESEDIWRKSVSRRHQTEIETPVPEDDPWKMVPYRTIWDFFYPSFNCPHTVERVGRVGDGGKWVCGISLLSKLSEPCIVYSFGISGDTSFEQELLDRTNCSVFAYDHTISSKRVLLPQKYPSRATFSKLGLGTENLDPLRTLKTEMDLRDHKFIDILKVDIEGAEFTTLPQILEDFPKGLPFGQLLVELHLGALGPEDLYKRLRVWWENLENAGLRPFHSEPNLYALSKIRPKPRFYEMSFLNIRVDHPVLHAASNCLQ